MPARIAGRLAANPQHCAATPSRRRSCAGTGARSAVAARSRWTPVASLSLENGTSSFAASDELCHRCDPSDFHSRPPTPSSRSRVLGQERALGPRVRVGMRAHDYNIFALGPPGVGKHTLVRQLLERRAAAEPVPPIGATCTTSSSRTALGHEAAGGRGAHFRRDMEQLVAELRAAIPARSRPTISAPARSNREEVKHLHDQAFGELQKEADAAHIAVVRTPTGVVLAPTRNAGSRRRRVREASGRGADEHQGSDREATGGARSALRKAPQWERQDEPRFATSCAR